MSIFNEVKIFFFTFVHIFKQMEACHVNKHSSKNEINVVRTFLDIETRCPFWVYKIEKNGIEDTVEITYAWKLEFMMTYCSFAYCTSADVIEHSRHG